MAWLESDLPNKKKEIDNGRILVGMHIFFIARIFDVYAGWISRIKNRDVNVKTRTDQI